MTTINNGVALVGTGLYKSNTLQSGFLRLSKSYVPDIDPRLPKHTALSQALAPTATVVVLADLSNVPIPMSMLGQVGALRVSAEVILYDQVFAGNSSIKILQRNVAGTGINTISTTIPAGIPVGLLGVRTQ